MKINYAVPRHEIHKSLFSFACKCAEIGIPRQDARRLILEGLAAGTPHRMPDDREIDDAVKGGFQRVEDLESASFAERFRSQPRFDRLAASRIYEERRIPVGELSRLSPLRPPTNTESVIRSLYQPSDLLCLGVDQKRCLVRSRAEWLEDADLGRFQFMVPHPMTARTGTTKSGLPNRPRTVANTGPRWVVVCEFDTPPLQWQPSLILHLAEFSRTLPTLVLHSGGKSLHAWFPIGDASGAAVDMFEREATRVGADVALLGNARRNQLVRTPNARRNNGQAQPVLFWNSTLVEGGEG